VIEFNGGMMMIAVCVFVHFAVVFLLAVLLLLRSFYFMRIKVSEIQGPA